MKTTTYLLVLFALLFTACTTSTNESQQALEEEPVTESITTTTIPATSVIDGYLGIKNALVADNSEAAAEAGRSLANALNQFDKTAIPAEKINSFNSLFDNVLEHAEHIIANGGNIAHQREHLAELGLPLKALIAITGTDRTLYYIHCPMYNNNEGGDWLSASNEVKNPFFGSTMLTCGVVKEEIVVM